MNRKWLVMTAAAAALSTGAAFAAGQYGQDSSSMGGQQTGQAAMGGAQQTLNKNSEAVREAQQALKEQGYDVGPVDGIYGPQTQQALSNFQQDQSIQASGQLDRDTASALGMEVGEFAEFEAMPSEEKEMRSPGMDEGSGMDSGSSEMDTPMRNEGGSRY